MKFNKGTLVRGTIAAKRWNNGKRVLETLEIVGVIVHPCMSIVRSVDPEHDGKLYQLNPLTMEEMHEDPLTEIQPPVIPDTYADSDYRDSHDQPVVHDD